MKLFIIIFIYMATFLASVYIDSITEDYTKLIFWVAGIVSTNFMYFLFMTD